MSFISCVMPTARRPEFARVAIAQFLSQALDEESELIIVDDPIESGSASIDTDMMGPRIRMIRDSGNVGRKRNLGVAAARGSLIVNWDDDDFFAVDRVAKQAQFHRLAGADVSLLSSMIYWRPGEATAWHAYFRADYGTGGTFCMATDFARQHPYPELPTGEDDAWLKGLPAGARVAGMSGSLLYVMRRHDSHTSTSAAFDEGPMWQIFGVPDGFRSIPYSEFEPIVSRWAPRPQQAA